MSWTRSVGSDPERVEMQERRVGHTDGAATREERRKREEDERQETVDDRRETGDGRRMESRDGRRQEKGECLGRDMGHGRRRLLTLEVSRVLSRMSSGCATFSIICTAYSSGADYQPGLVPG